MAYTLPSAPDTPKRKKKPVKGKQGTVKAAPLKMKLPKKDLTKLQAFVKATSKGKNRRVQFDRYKKQVLKKGSADFLDAAIAKKKAGTPAKGGGGGGGGGAAAAPDPYARYRGTGVETGIGTLEAMDKQSAAHQVWGKGVSDWLAGQVNPIQQAGAQAQQYYAGLGSQYAGMGALPAVQPAGATVAGQQVTPGTATPAIQSAGMLGQATAASGTQASSYQGWLADQQGRSLGQGLLAHQASLNAQIPGIYNEAKNQYMQKLDEQLFEMEQGQREAEAEAALEELKMANERYIAQTRLVGDLTGTQAKVQLGQLDADTKVATTNAQNASRESVAAGQNASRERVAAMDNSTKLLAAKYKGRIDVFKARLKQAADGAKRTKAQKDLLREVQKAFDEMWKGEAPDPLKPGSGSGWRFTARGGAKGREKAGVQIVGWLQSTGLNPQQIHRLMRSKGFSDKEFQRAVRIVEGGGGF